MANIFPAHSSWSSIVAADFYTDDTETNPYGFVPQAADVLGITEYSGNGTIGGDTNALDNLVMTGFTGGITTIIAGGPFTIDIDNHAVATAILDGGVNGVQFEVTGNLEVNSGMSFYATAFTPKITHNGSVIGDYTITTNGETGDVDFVVSNAGVTSLTAQDASVWKSFDFVANSEYTDGAYAHDIGGDIIIGNSAGFVSTGDWTQTASGNVSCPNNSSPFHSLSLAVNSGDTATLTGSVKTKVLIRGDGAITGAGQALRIYNTPEGEYAWQEGDTVGVVDIAMVQLYWEANNVKLSKMNLPDLTDKLEITMYNGKTASAYGDITCPALTIEATTGSPGTCTLGMSGKNLIAGAIRLGSSTDATKKGKIDCGSGRITLASLQADKNDTAGNVCVFGSAYVISSGLILGVQNANEITFTSDDARITGGTLTGVNCTGRLWCQPQTVTDGGGNSGDVLFRPKPRGIGMGVAA